MQLRIPTLCQFCAFHTFKLSLTLFQCCRWGLSLANFHTKSHLRLIVMRNENMAQQDGVAAAATAAAGAEAEDAWPVHALPAAATPTHDTGT